jgi:hypothetical protein
MRDLDHSWFLAVFATVRALLWCFSSCERQALVWLGFHSLSLLSRSPRVAQRTTRAVMAREVPAHRLAGPRAEAAAPSVAEALAPAEPAREERALVVRVVAERVARRAIRARPAWTRRVRRSSLRATTMRAARRFSTVSSSAPTTPALRLVSRRIRTVDRFWMPSTPAPSNSARAPAEAARTHARPARCPSAARRSPRAMRTRAARNCSTASSSARRTRPAGTGATRPTQPGLRCSMPRTRAWRRAALPSAVVEPH